MKFKKGIATISVEKEGNFVKKVFQTWNKYKKERDFYLFTSPLLDFVPKLHKFNDEAKTIWTEYCGQSLNLKYIPKYINELPQLIKISYDNTNLKYIDYNPNNNIEIKRDGEIDTLSKAIEQYRGSGARTSTTNAAFVPSQNGSNLSRKMIQGIIGLNNIPKLLSIEPYDPNFINGRGFINQFQIEDTCITSNCDKIAVKQNAIKHDSVKNNRIYSSNSLKKQNFANIVKSNVRNKLSQDCITKIQSTNRPIINIPCTNNTVIKQANSVVLKHSDNKVCKNRIEMPFKELIKHISKKLMGYAMTLSDNDPDDALDLIQSTMVKLIKNQDKLMDSDQPMAYAKKILLNDFRDGYRKKQKMPLVSIEANNIPVRSEGFQEDAVAYQEMLTCLESFDETDRTILAMLGAGHSYTEIQEVVSDISMANLRVKANRARIKLAKCMDRKI